MCTKSIQKEAKTEREREAHVHFRFEYVGRSLGSKDSTWVRSHLIFGRNESQMT